MNMKIAFPKWTTWLLRQLIPNVGTVLVVLSLLFAFDARAAGLNTSTSPSTISYQGTLSTANGTVVSGSKGFTFKLYNVLSGGTALWTEAHTGVNAVPVSNGLFNVTLGSITPIPSTVWNNTTVFLGVQVEGDSAELSPREMVSAVPIAMMTTNITIPDGSVTTAKIADGAVTQAKAPMLLGSLVSNQFIQTGTTQTFNLQPGWNGVVYTTIFPVPFTSAPVVIGVDVSDNMANMGLNIITNSSPQNVAWGFWSGHTSGTRQIVIKWIAVGN
jgi:hypothetical protein